MTNPGPARLKLEVTLMDEPSLWRWDVKDPVQDQIIASSWEQEWTGYRSRDEAYRAGTEWLRSAYGAAYGSAYGAPRPSNFARWRFGASD